MMNKKNIKGLTLIEILIGVAITALMMGAMFASYSVVNNSYNQVTDKAKVSRSSRDIVGMIIKDIRLAGFKYYYGANDEGIEQFHDLEHISGSESDRTVNDSHDPIIVFKDKGISIFISIRNFVNPKLEPASLKPLPTCLIPKLVKRIIGGSANIIVATTPGVNPTPKSITTGIK